METTRAVLADEQLARRAPRASRLQRAVSWIGYRVVLPSRRILRALSWVLLVLQRLRLVPSRAGVPRLTVAGLRTRLAADAATTDIDAWLFTGCVMDAWMRPTHLAALRVMRATGARVAASGSRGACCGALHVHAGRTDGARALARRVIASMPGDAPVVVDSAGCGAAMHAYERLLGTREAATFAARVVDFSSFVAKRGLPALRAQHAVVVVADPCHLRHVQRAHGAVREVLGAAYELRETDDDGLCCGAGGAYATLEPDLSGRIRARKVDAIVRAGGDACIVASANPGCTFHLQAAGIDARHPAELLAAALDDGATHDA